MWGRGGHNPKLEGRKKKLCISFLWCSFPSPLSGDWCERPDLRELWGARDGMQQAALSQPSWALKLVYMTRTLPHHHRLKHYHLPHLHSPAGLHDPDLPRELAAKARLGRRSDPSGAEPRAPQKPTNSALRTLLPFPPAPQPPSFSRSWRGRGFYQTATQPVLSGGAGPLAVHSVRCRLCLAPGPGADGRGRSVAGLGLPPGAWWNAQPTPPVLTRAICLNNR